jgi:hypothetical protein
LEFADGSPIPVSSKRCGSRCLAAMSDMRFASFADAVTANVWLNALLVLELAANLHE